MLTQRFLTSPVGEEPPNDLPHPTEEFPVDKGENSINHAGIGEAATHLGDRAEWHSELEKQVQVGHSLFFGLPQAPFEVEAVNPAGNRAACVLHIGKRRVEFEIGTFLT